MKVIQKKIEELKFAEYNPRAATEKEFADLKESLTRYGFVEPIVVNSAEERKDVIIGGHFRVRVAEDLGMKEVPVVYVNIPDIKKEQELNLRLNRNLGHWDFGMLANFDEEMLLDVGFGKDELDTIFGLEMAEDFDEQKELDKAIKEPRGVKDGDLWELGQHRLVIGDCTNRKNWEKVIGKERFDFMFTDPPYRLAYTKKRVKKIKTKQGMKLKRARTYLETGETDARGKPKQGFGYKQDRHYQGVTMKGVPEYDEWLSIANEYQNPKGTNIMIFENWRNVVDLWKAIEKYWKIRNIIIWWLPNRHQGFGAKYKFFSKYDIAPLADKGKPVLNQEYEIELEEYLQKKGQRLIDTYEVIIYGNKGDSNWEKQKGTKWAKIADHISHTAESESSSGQNLVFGTKPIQILVPYIKILSPRDGIVVEPFGGSGSTIIASEIMHRKCRAIEISPLYGEVILNRFERYTGQKPKKIGKS